MTTSRPDTTTQQPPNGITGRVTDAGWHRIGETHGAPLWQWQEDVMVRVATTDHDILRIIGAALNRCDEMPRPEFDQFIAEHLFGGRSGMLIHEDEPALEVAQPIPRATKR